MLPFLVESGGAQMAADQWMLERPGTYLRFYQWSVPTLSLGRNQALDPEMDLEAAKAAGVKVVRRATGGQAVLHHLELTYSFASSTPPFPKSILESYQAVRQPVLTGLQSLGLAAKPGLAGKFRPTGSVCFSQAQGHEVVVGDKKLVGSAQRRKGSRFLQHGSILLDQDFPLLAQVWPGKTAQSWRQETTTLKSALGEVPAVSLLVRHLTEAFGVQFQVEPTALEWSKEDWDWIKRQSPGFCL